jgi:hypothetical protein
LISFLKWLRERSGITLLKNRSSLCPLCSFETTKEYSSFEFAVSINAVDPGLRSSADNRSGLLALRVSLFLRRFDNREKL